MTHPTRAFSAAAVAAAVFLTSSCETLRPGRLTRQVGESCVFIGARPAHFSSQPSLRGGMRVRSTYLEGPDTVEYVEGEDYVLNRKERTIQRTAKSRIPDFQNNVLFGQEGFDHSKFPGFGNTTFFAFVDYTLANPIQWPVQPEQRELLPRTRVKLREGEKVRIVAFGDSITAGGDATKPEFIFWNRWADALREKYPKASITAGNGATGGDSTVQGLARLQEKVIDLKPDLVLIGFGMNDHNRGGVPIPQFEANLKEMIAKIRATTTAEIVLFSAFPPNPKWTFGTRSMEKYATATARVAKETTCAFADVYTNWQAIATKKKPEDLLGNNINHPNDYGHWIYFETLNGMGL